MNPKEGAPGNAPYDKDPLGNGVELPFIQPVMTSATKWSNKPSFGISLAVSYQQYWYSQPWQAFAADNAKIWQSHGTEGDQDMVVTFEYPVCPSAVAFYRTGWVAPTTHVFFFLDRDGEWERAGEWTWVKGVDPESGDFACAFERPFYTRRLLIRMPYADNGSYPTLCNVRVSAVHGREVYGG